MKLKANTSAIVFLLCLVGCSVITDVDTSFLYFNGSRPDAGYQPCGPAVAPRESPFLCHNECDDDGDGLIDRDDDDCPHYFYCYNNRRDIPELESCNDRCDNDWDGLVDCNDDDCEGSAACFVPLPPEGSCRGDDEDPPCCAVAADGDADADENICCNNRLDDDGDGRSDCEDEDCMSSDFCCGSTRSHQENADNAFDETYWESFRVPPNTPRWDEEAGRIVDWNDGTLVGGVASREPFDLTAGLNIQFVAHIPLDIEYCTLGTCPGYTGIALSSSGAPSRNDPISAHFRVLVTPDRRIVVLRMNRVLHTVGIAPPAVGDERPTFVFVNVTFFPMTLGPTERGFGMELRVLNGRQNCDPDGSLVGCPEEPEWISDELVLYEDDNVLSNGARGTYLMIIGHGTGVELSDAPGETIKVQHRSCANPSTWRPNEVDDRIGESYVCWALGAVGSPSIAHVANDHYIMVVEGTTRTVLLDGLGFNNYSLGWLEIWDDPNIVFWDQHPDAIPRDPISFRPIDTVHDHNCMGLTSTAWSESCAGYELFPTDVPGGCRDIRSHRSPHVIAQTTQHVVLFSQSLEPGSNDFQIASATFNPSARDWAPNFNDAHILVPDEVNFATDGEYRSLRDPVAVCPRENIREGICWGNYVVFIVAEPDLETGISSHDLLTVEYNISTGFALDTIAVALDGRAESNPLFQRKLAEPWILYDEKSEHYFLWITTSLFGQPNQVDLLLAPGSELAPPLAEVPWELYVGSPVIRELDLEHLWPGEDYRAVDCSGRCVIGGVTAIVVPEAEYGRDMLHLWVSLAERPASDDAPIYRIRHLEQYFGLP